MRQYRRIRLAMACATSLLAHAAFASSPDYSLTTSIANLSYELIDLGGGSGSTPSVTFGAGLWTVGNRAPGADFGLYELVPALAYSGSLLPQGTQTVSNGGAVMTTTANSVTFQASASGANMAAQMAPELTNVAPGSYSVATIDAGGHIAAANSSDGWQGQTVTLSAHSALVLRGTLSYSYGVNAVPFLDSVRAMLGNNQQLDLMNWNSLTVDATVSLIAQPAENDYLGGSASIYWGTNASVHQSQIESSDYTPISGSFESPFEIRLENTSDSALVGKLNVLVNNDLMVSSTTRIYDRNMGTPPVIVIPEVPTGPIPEAPTWAMMMLGLVGAFSVARRQRSQP